MARSAKLKRNAKTGKHVSARSKTGQSMCSQAMSSWKTSGMTPAVAATLGKCRSIARRMKQGAAMRTAGNEGRAQHQEHIAQGGGPVTVKERMAKARALRAGRAAKPGGAVLQPVANTVAKPTLKSSTHERLAGRYGADSPPLTSGGVRRASEAAKQLKKSTDPNEKRAAKHLSEQAKRIGAERSSLATEKRRTGTRQGQARQAMTQQAAANSDRRFYEGAAYHRQSQAETLRRARKGIPVNGITVSRPGSYGGASSVEMGQPALAKARERTSAVVARATALRAQRAAKPAATAPAPTLRQQADAARAKRYERLNSTTSTEQNNKSVMRKQMAEYKKRELESARFGRSADKINKLEKTREARYQGRSNQIDQMYADRAGARRAEVLSANKMKAEPPKSRDAMWKYREKESALLGADPVFSKLSKRANRSRDIIKKIMDRRRDEEVTLDVPGIELTPEFRRKRRASVLASGKRQSLGVSIPRPR